MGGGKLCIRFQPGDVGIRFLNVCRELRQQFVFQTIFLALVVGFQHFQLCDLHIQIHLLLDERITGAQCLDLRIGQRLLIHIIAGTHRGFAGHNLRDKSLFIFQSLKQITVKCPFRNVIEHLDFRILIALPDDATIALGHVAGLPANIQMMHRHKSGLDVGACTHFCRTSEQNSHIARAHFGEQCRLFRFGVGVVDKLDLIFRHTGSNQLLANVIVDVEVTVIFRGGEVAEQKLCQLLIFAFLPDLQHVLNAYVQFAVGVVRQHGVHQANVQADFSAIVGDAEHIVHGRIHDAGVDICGTFAQFLHHFLLNFGRLCHHGFKLCDRHRQMKLVASFNVRNLLEHGHQFRQIEELCKSRSRPIACTFRGQFDCSGGLPKSGGPAVEMGEVLFLQRAILQIAHNRVQFRHRVAHRRTRGKNHPAPAGHFIQIAALAEHVRRFLCLACTQTCDIPHFCVQKEVFERVRFVHKKPVNAQLLEGDHIILALIRAQFFQLCFQRFPGLFHLLDGEILACVDFQLIDGGKRFINLLLNDTLLPLKGQRNTLKLAMPDDDGVVVAGGDAGAEFFAVGSFKVLAPCHQEFGVRIEVQKLRCPLLRQMVGHHKKTFLAQSQPFCFHSGCRHFVGFACANFVCKQRITAIKHMSNGVALVFPESDLRVHADEMDVGAIVFTGAGGVKQLVVLLHQRNAPLGVLPDPVRKSVLDDLLFLLRQHGLPLVQHTLGFAISILDGVVDADIFQVQGFFQNLVGIGTGCAVGLGGDNIAPSRSGLALHAPLCGIRRISHLDCMAQIVGDLESLGHKFLNDFRRKPCGTQPHINFRCFQFSGLCLNQRIHIDRKFRVGLCRKLRHPQLCPDIAGKVLVCHLPAGFRVSGVGGRVLEDHTEQLCGDAPVLAGRAQQLRHIGQVYFAMLPDGYRQRFAGGIHAGDGALRANGALGEHRCLGFKLPLLVQIFKRTEQIVGGILLK